MKYFAIIKGDVVDGIAIGTAPLDTDGKWIDVTDMNPMPHTNWTYRGGVFSPREVIDSPLISPPISEKTEEQKIADATAAAIAKLIADGVLKQA